MLREHHRWYSHRLGRDMDILVYGHYGSPIVAFPTSGGDHREYEGQGMIEAIAHHIDAGKVKVFCVDTANNQSWYNKQAHPRHRSYVQAMYDAYMSSEVAPFIHDHCRSPGIAITTTGSSFGAYHAANTLLKHPDLFRRCLALSGVYDIRGFMDGDYDDNFYFNNPVDYMASLSDPGTSTTCISATSAWPRGTAPSKTAARPIGWPRSCAPRESRTPWTTGARTAATTGPSGSAR